MKKYIFFTVLILSSCGDAYDSYQCFKTVETKYPDTKIWRFYDSDYSFLVIDSNCNILYVQTLDMSSTRITKEIKVN